MGGFFDIKTKTITCNGEQVTAKLNHFSRILELLNISRRKPTTLWGDCEHSGQLEGPYHCLFTSRASMSA